MGCAITEGRDRICKDLQGGVDRVYIFPFVLYDKSQFVRDGMTLLTFPLSTIYEFEILKGSSLDQKQDDKDGLKSYKQTLNIKLAQNQFLYGIETLIKKDLRIIIKDNNGKFRLLGAYNGVECTSIEYTTGASKKDLNGATLSFEATEREEALFIDAIPDSSFEIGDFLLLEDGSFLLFEDGSLIEL